MNRWTFPNRRLLMISSVFQMSLPALTGSINSHFSFDNRTAAKGFKSSGSTTIFFASSAFRGRMVRSRISRIGLSKLSMVDLPVVKTGPSLSEAYRKFLVGVRFPTSKNKSSCPFKPKLIFREDFSKPKSARLWAFSISRSSLRVSAAWRRASATSESTGASMGLTKRQPFSVRMS